MLSLLVTSYFIGPKINGNVFGGLTSKSQKRVLSGSLSFNNSVFLLVKYTDTSEITYASFAGTPPSNTHREYLSSGSYEALKTEWDARVGTSSGSFVWEKEEYLQ